MPKSENSVGKIFLLLLIWVNNKGLISIFIGVVKHVFRLKVICGKLFEKINK